MNMTPGIFYRVITAGGDVVEFRLINVDSNANLIIETPIGSGAREIFQKIIGGYSSLVEITPDEELLKKVISRINLEVNGDTLTTVYVRGLDGEFPTSSSEQIDRVIERARQQGLVWVSVSAVGLTPAGVQHARS